MLAEESRTNKWERAQAIQHRRQMERDLAVSQRIWLKYREAACTAVHHSLEGGTFGPIAELNCRTALTQERASLVRDYFGVH